MSTAKKGKAYPSQNILLYEFAKAYTERFGHVGNGFIKYETWIPRILAPKIQAWGLANGYNITATPQNNSVIVEIAPNKLDGVNERIDELKDVLR